ncbi:MAG: hypothetical protein CM1200mP3_10690 [Chloroflexota bacterium]|nr:MAG: hypothetical protein CM1200mP3_10690 [Chloroflexota bacterium]
MSTLALILVLSSSVSHAVWNLLLKRSVDKEAFMFLSQIAISVLFAPISIFMFFRSPIGDIGWVFVVGTGILHVFYFVFLSRGYKYGELSEVYPVARGAGPGLTPVRLFCSRGKCIHTGSIRDAFSDLWCGTCFLGRIIFKNIARPREYLQKDGYEICAGYGGYHSDVFHMG